MATTQHRVALTPAERAQLDGVLARGVHPARELTHAQILLHADRNRPGRVWTDRMIAEAVGVSPRTVARVRMWQCTEGLARALGRKPPDRVYARKLDGAGEAVLTELACGPAPEGYAHWSLRLLGDKLVELEVVDGIAPSTVAATLKKGGSSRG
jgi:hypothetical protein